MKKYIKLKIISSILGVLSICGAFCCSILIHDQTKSTQSVCAYGDDYVLLYEGSNSSIISFNASNSDYEGVTNIQYSCSYRYFLQGTSPYEHLYLNYSISFRYTFVDSNGQLYTYNTNLNSFDSGDKDLGNNVQGVYRVILGFSRTVLSISCTLIGQKDGTYLTVVGAPPSISYTPSDLPFMNVGTSVSTAICMFNYGGSVSTYSTGYQDGYNDGVAVGYQQGYQEGNSFGFDTGYNQAVADLQDDIQNAYSSGYTNGYNEGFSSDSTAVTIMSGIFQVALVPVNFFLSVFNFEILGINLGAVIQALITVALTIIVIKVVLGKKGD